jgi:hypothetical protein
MIVLGLLLLIAAGAVALGGIFANSGSGHALAQSFTVFGYELEGSSGRIFVYGIVVGVIAALGFGLLVAGLNRGVRHRVATRRELRRARQEKEVLQRQHDELASRLDDEHARAEGRAPTVSERPPVEDRSSDEPGVPHRTST